MNPSAMGPRQEMLEGELPAAPAPVRYPQSSVRYALRSLTESGPRPTRGKLRTPHTFGRLRRMRLHARSLVWWIPLWYVIGQLSLFLWMDENWELNRTRVERHKWEQLHERLAEAPDRPLILMLGSSRTDWAFQAGRLSGQPGPDGRPLLAYNMGLQTYGPIHANYYLDELLGEGVRPRLVVLEFVTTHLNQSRRGLLSEEHFTLPRWCSFHQLWYFRHYFTNPKRALGEWLESRVAPWYGFSYFVHEHIVGREKPVEVLLDQCRQPMDSWGSRILFEDPGTPEYRSRRWTGAFNMYGLSLQHFQLGAGPTQAMCDLLARCRREKIPVALVVLPVTKEFNALFPAEARAELDNLRAELIQRYDAHLIDATDWLPREEFDDGHHVLKSGAYHFTTRMIEEINKLLARTEPSAAQLETP